MQQHEPPTLNQRGLTLATLETAALTTETRRDGRTMTATLRCSVDCGGSISECARDLPLPTHIMMPRLQHSLTPLAFATEVSGLHQGDLAKYHNIINF